LFHPTGSSVIQKYQKKEKKKETNDMVISRKKKAKVWRIRIKGQNIEKKMNKKK